MKSIKKIVAVILVVVTLVCSFSVFSVSAKNNKQDFEEFVALVHMGYRDGAKMFEGHAFLYFENLTDNEIMVGVYPVPPRGSVSVGTFGSMDAGSGLYYNVEAYRYTLLKLTDYISIQKYLTEDDLEVISEKITHSGFWNKFFNCTYFALTTWNEVPGKNMIWLIFPEFTNLQIKSYSDHKGAFPMTMPAEEDVYKQVGEGKDAKLVRTSWHMTTDTVR